MEQYQPLFLKYRPQSLADLVGQRYVSLTLANAIEHDRISHAYLFTGPRGTGKTSSARILAKSLNCEKGPTTKPCQTCTNCVEIKEGVSTAVMEIDAASNNSVDDARVLIERAPLLAPGGRFKLYIIDECHMLTKEAFNALLKTIEEPPNGVIFILATTEEHKVPPTIHSRCQRLMFRLISQEEMFAHLGKIAKQEEIAIEPAALDLIARHSGGGLRDALGLLDQASLLSSPDHSVSEQDLFLLVGALAEDMLVSLSKSVIEGDGYATLSSANQLLTEGKEAHLIASELARHFLNLAKVACLETSDKQSQTRLAALVKGSPKYIQNLSQLSKGLDRAELAAMVESLDRLEQACKRSSQPALNLEIGLLSLCHRLDLNNLKAIEDRVIRLESQFSPAELDLPPKPMTKPTSASQPSKPPEKNAPTTADAATNDPPQAEKPGVAKEDAEALEPVALDAVEPNSEHNLTVQDGSSGVDLDLFWSQLLEELQKRHLPTFSLVSTHAFPMSLSENELTIGVLVESFQKMIENKVDHVQAACAAITGKSLKIRVKVVDQSSPGEQDKGKKSKEGKRGQKQQEVLKSAPEDDLSDPEATAGPETTAVAESKVPLIAKKNGEISSGSGLSHLIQDAYRLFEGPGSRLITANQ
jgi:DNA polymerase-3 subunit gamma/tau